MRIFEYSISGLIFDPRLIISALLLFAMPIAHAQEPSGDRGNDVLEEIVVIGSHLKRRDFTSPSPIATLDRQALSFAIQPTMEELLNQMPQVTPDFDRTSNNPGDGTASVNLRGLGSGRNLVLLNGRRLASSGVGSSVDINNIPHALIERVEVITGGATTVYGSDAVAGVVNFVTHDDFDGFGLDTSFYTTAKNDSDIFDMNLSYGHNFANGRGNISLFAGYYDRQSTSAGDRDFTSVTLADFGGEVVPGGSFRNPAGVVFSPRADLGEGPVFVTFDANGDPRANVDPDDLFDPAASAYLQTPLQRVTGGLFLNYDLNDRHEAYVEIMHSTKDSAQKLSPIAAAFSAETNFDNPVLTPASQQVFEDNFFPVRDNIVAYFIGRRLSEVGDRATNNNRDYSRVAAGLRGELNSTWNYDAWMTYTSGDEDTRLLNDASRSQLLQGLLVDPVTGQCFDPSNGCVPVDIFGPGRISADAVAFIGLPPLRNSTSRKQKLVSAFISGSPFDSWAGAVDTVLGIEWREDSGSFTADDALFTGDALGFVGDSSVNGTESVFELYGELLLPIVEDARFAEYLGLEFGARYSDYKNADAVDTYKIGGEWHPNQSFHFRAMYQKSVRAPNLKEAFQDQFTAFGRFVTNNPAQDPCSASADPLGNGNLEKCVITGLPENQVGVWEATVDFPTEFVSGGNPDLNTEQADTLTVGMVVNLLSSRNLTISVDYFDLQVNDTIGNLNTELACFDASNANGTFCDLIRRDSASFDVNQVIETVQNRGSLRTKGVDTQINYHTELPGALGIVGNDADLGIKLFWTHVTKNTVQETPTGTELRCHGHFGFPCSGNSGTGYGLTFPVDRVSAYVNYDSGNLGIQLAWRWYASTKAAELLLPEYLGTPPRDLAITGVSSKSYLDLGVSYDFSENIVTRFNIGNLTDTSPPLMADHVASNNTDTHMFDIFGRSYSLSLSLRY